MNVLTKPLKRPSGNINLEFHQELAQIFGNKKVTVVLDAQPNTSDAGPVVFSITSQKDETGADVTAFAYDTATNLLKPTADISNIKNLEFHHLINYEGGPGSGGNNDANDNIAVVQRIVDTDGGTEILEEIDRINSAVDLGTGEFIQKRVVTRPFPPADPTQELGINSLIGLG